MEQVQEQQVKVQKIQLLLEEKLGELSETEFNELLTEDAVKDSAFMLEKTRKKPTIK